MLQDALPWQDKQLLAGTPVYVYTMAVQLRIFAHHLILPFSIIKSYRLHHPDDHA